MLKRLEIIDFESHEHTVLDGFSPELTLICGKGDCGKTAIIRAVKLVALNDFNPKSVRTGKKNAIVKITTDKGWVKVTRGEKNEWEVCRNGEEPKTFTKVGKNPLPEAQEVIGIKTISMGGIDIPVNIMDQMESHFLLNEVGNTESSGSTRALVVDELSGMKGLEEIIKSVSLDRTRYGKEVKQLEEQSQTLREKKHDPAALAIERKLLESAEELFSNIRDGKHAIRCLTEYKERHDRCIAKQNNIQDGLSLIPDIDGAGDVLAVVVRKYEKLKGLTKLFERYKSAINKAKEIPPDIEKQLLLFSSIANKKDKLDRLLALVSKIQKSIKAIDASSVTAIDMQVDIAEKERELKETISKVKVCPITGQPVKCFENKE